MNPIRHRWLIRYLKTSALAALMALLVTWFGAVYDHPMDGAIIAAMQAPACASVRSMPAGGVLSNYPPVDDICRSFFLYRATNLNAAVDAAGYEASIVQDRFAEFRELAGYLLIFFVVAVSVMFAGLLISRSIFSGVLPRLGRGHSSRSGMSGRSKP